MPELEAYCLSATPFTSDNQLDEEALRALLDRFVDARIGLYLASGGNGESHALSRDELRRLYEIGVSECAGKVPVQANLPESHTPREAIEQATLAHETGVEVVHMYTVEERHGMRPTRDEYVAYFDSVLSEVRGEVVLCVNATVGYLPPPEVLSQLTSRYHQVIGIRATNATPGYLIAIKDAITRADMRYYAILANAPTALALGVDGIFGSKANLVPRTVRAFMDLCDTGDYHQYGPAYAELMRLHSHVMQWHPAGARWIKMGMKVLGLPGGEGGVRPPYLMPVDDLQRYTEGLLALGIPEIDELVASASAQA